MSTRRTGTWRVITRGARYAVLRQRRYRIATAWKLGKDNEGDRGGVHLTVSEAKMETMCLHGKIANQRPRC